MTKIVLIEGVVEVKYDAEGGYQPHILRKGGKEARNPKTGEMLITEDKMIALDWWGSSLGSAAKYAATQLAHLEYDDKVLLKDWLATIRDYTEQMNKNIAMLS